MDGDVLSMKSGLPLEVSLEQVRVQDNIEDIIFRRGESKKAGRALIEWLKGKGGGCTDSEMNQFSKRLAAGEVGCSLGRSNFYKTILRRFTDLGLIVEQPVFDSGRKRVVNMYVAIHQPIGKRKPLGPSLPLIAHLIAEK